MLWLCFLSSAKYFIGPSRLEQISRQLLLKSPIQLGTVTIQYSNMQNTHFKQITNEYVCSSALTYLLTYCDIEIVEMNSE